MAISPENCTGRDFVRLILSFALGFVRVSFPRAIAVGFSFSELTAASEMSAAPVEVHALLDRDFRSEPRLISSLDRDFRIARGALPRRGRAAE